MTATQSQIRDALERVIENSKSYAWSFLDMDGYKQNEADCLTLRQSALDTQKPAGDAGDFSVLYEIKDSLPNPSQVRDKLNIWLYHNDPKLPHNKG